jgi:hypothetical protein
VWNLTLHKQLSDATVQAKIELLVFIGTHNFNSLNKELILIFYKRGYLKVHMKIQSAQNGLPIAASLSHVLEQSSVNQQDQHEKILALRGEKSFQ